MAFPDMSGATDPQNMPIVRHHIERGDTAKGADGATIGTIVQMVMDLASGQPSAIVIHSDDSNSEFELPWSHITDTSGGQVRLDVSGKDIASVALPYNPDHYVPVDTGQAVPSTQAGKIAQDERHPVVTAVQPDAVEFVEPQSPTDDATRPYPSLPPSNLKRTAPLIPEPIPPTQPLSGRRQASNAAQRELKTERDTLKPAPNAPPVETSPLASTEGELVGGKPSTSGVGVASTVPTSGTERSGEGLGASEPRPAEQMPPTSSAGRPDTFMSTPPVSDVSSRSVSTPPAQSGAATPVSQFGGKVQQIGTSMRQAARQVAAIAEPTGRQVALTVEQVRLNVAERWKLPVSAGVAAVGLGAGALAGTIAVIRQRRVSSRYQLKQIATTASGVQDTVGSLLQQTQASAQDVASIAQDKAARASQQAKRTAKRAARRARWFRNGLLLGGVLGILFAPEPGAEIRTQLANRLEQWRSKIA